jgi:hypothetical protein
LKGLGFEDDSIKVNELSAKDRELYNELSNPKKWKQFKATTTAATRQIVARFKE